jgi:hypothetical protein
MTEQLESGIARLLVNRVIVGSGFLIRDRHILTCAHTIRVLLKRYPETPPLEAVPALVEFPLLNPKTYFVAKICHYRPEQDVAGLKLDKQGPVGSHPLQLLTSDDLWGHPFRAYGFPVGYEDGVWASGVLRGRNAAGWIQIEDEKVPGYWVKPGFSGTPIWDEALNGVVGMAVAADTDETVKAAYMIPANILAEAWPGAVRVQKVNVQKTSKPSAGEQSGGVKMGDVNGGIQGSIIAGRDVYMNAGTRQASEPQRPDLSINQARLIALHGILTERFSLEDLRTLCFQLGVDWDNLPGRGKGVMARELLRFLKHRERLADLVSIGKQQRPDIPWDEIIDIER